MRNRETRILIAAAAVLLTLVAVAIEPPKPATPPATPAPSKQEPPATPPAAPAEEKPATPAPGTPASEDEKEAEDEETLPPLPPGTVPAGPPPARFNPTEKVRADFPVSFPIDI